MQFRTQRSKRRTWFMLFLRSVVQTIVFKYGKHQNIEIGKTQNTAIEKTDWKLLGNN